jgi:hypothetical protein
VRTVGGDLDAEAEQPADTPRHEPFTAGRVDGRPAAIDDRHRHAGHPRLDGRGEPGRTGPDNEQIPISHALSD